MSIVDENLENHYRESNWPHLYVEGWEDVECSISFVQTIGQPEIDVMIGGRIALDDYWLNIPIKERNNKKIQLRDTIFDASKKLTRMINGNLTKQVA